MNTWYERYDELRQDVEDRKNRLEARCLALGVKSNIVLREIRLEVISRAVQESNWQEGLYLGEARTQELTIIAFEHMKHFTGPRLNMQSVLEEHAQQVSNMIKNNSSAEEIAAYNLAKAHVVINYIRLEIQYQQSAFLYKLFVMSSFDKINDPSDEFAKTYKLLSDFFKNQFEDITPMSFPTDNSIDNVGQFLYSLSEVELKQLIHFFTIDYIHLLHNIVLMGILASDERGVFRQIHVHVADPNIIFAPPSLVYKLVQEFCSELSILIMEDKLKNVVKTISSGKVNLPSIEDSILFAAKTSHSFVRIHPYADGNGRISRLMMNLILLSDFPPVYLKADKKGRRRYIYALRLANRGNIKPLGCLIAMSLIEIYDKVLNSLDSHLVS